VSRFQFVADHQHAFEVKRLCEVVQVARSSFYAWQNAAPVRASRTAADAELADRIRTIHDQDRALGAPRITAELNDGAQAGERVNHKRVARVMRGHAIAGLRLRRRVRTTIPEPAELKVSDLLGRDFSATAPNQRYVGDITYLPIADGSNLYLATVIDCYSRRLAGGRSPSICAPTWSPPRSPPPGTRGVRWPGRSFTPIMEPSTARRSSPSSAPGLG
jgi:transposase InsO family protein